MDAPIQPQPPLAGRTSDEAALQPRPPEEDTREVVISRTSITFRNFASIEEAAGFVQMHCQFGRIHGDLQARIQEAAGANKKPAPTQGIPAFGTRPAPGPVQR